MAKQTDSQRGKRFGMPRAVSGRILRLVLTFEVPFPILRRRRGLQ